MISEQTEKDITVAIEKSYRIGYRAGIEAVRDWVRKHSSPSEEEWYALLDQKAFDEFIYGLLKEAGDD